MRRLERLKREQLAYIITELWPDDAPPVAATSYAASGWSGR